METLFEAVLCTIQVVQVFFIDLLIFGFQPTPIEHTPIVEFGPLLNFSHTHNTQDEGMEFFCYFYFTLFNALTIEVLSQSENMDILHDERKFS